MLFCILMEIKFCKEKINQGDCQTCTRYKSNSYDYTIKCAATDKDIVNNSQGFYCPLYNNGEPIKI